MIASQNRIIDMLQIYFELPGRVFRQRCACRNILRATDRGQVQQERINVRQIIKT